MSPVDLFVLAAWLIPADLDSFGALTIIPAAFLLLYIFQINRFLESLAPGTSLGCVMLYKPGFFEPLNEQPNKQRFAAHLAQMICFLKDRPGRLAPRLKCHRPGNIEFIKKIVGDFRIMEKYKANISI